ncbi:MAG: hypothetical protein AAF901_01640 [Bacteroidota bacterium]
MKKKIVLIIGFILFSGNVFSVGKSTSDFMYGRCLNVAIAAYDSAISVGLSHDQAESIAYRTLEYCHHTIE